VALGASAATGSFLGSILYMAAFGAGTFPMMLAIGLGATRLQFNLRLRGQKLIPAAVALVGFLLLLRGLALGIPYLSPSPAGPSCH
jgi:sulfite exporter TauE/SafE